MLDMNDSYTQSQILPYQDNFIQLELTKIEKKIWFVLIFTDFKILLKLHQVIKNFRQKSFEEVKFYYFDRCETSVDGSDCFAVYLLFQIAIANYSHAEHFKNTTQIKLLQRHYSKISPDSYYTEIISGTAGFVNRNFFDCKNE